MTDTTQLSTHRNSFAVHADKIAGMGLWLDERALGDIFVAQRLVDVLTERGTSGWLAQSSFVEI